MGRKKKESNAKVAARRRGHEAAQVTYQSRLPLQFAPPPKVRGSALFGMLICSCIQGGVSASSLANAARPVSSAEARRGVRFYEPAPEVLKSVIMGDGVVPPELHAEVRCDMEQSRQPPRLSHEHAPHS